MKTNKRATVALLFLLLIPLTVWAHGGGLDKYGCHLDRTAGNYHCHQGPLSGQSFSSQGEMLQRLQQKGGIPKVSPSSIPIIPVEGVRQCVRVIDGDTIVLNGGEKIRLIGVDTPETKHPKKPVQYFGKEATAFTRRMVEGKQVRLAFDQANAHLGHKDKYRRALAYAFLEDGTLLNAEIIKQGYGFAYTRFPFARMEEFRRYEREAREAGRGLWAAR